MAVNKDILDSARDRLEQELAHIQSELKDLGASPDGSVEVTLDEGFADAAQATSERSKVLSMVENLQQRLRDVEAALGRVERGVYGLCERCGKPINPERLEVVPAARFCIEHASQR